MTAHPSAMSDIPDDPGLHDRLAGEAAHTIVWPLGSVVDFRGALLLTGGLLAASLVHHRVGPASGALLFFGFRFAVICLLVSALVEWWRWTRHAAGGYIPIALRGTAMVHGFTGDVFLLMGLLASRTPWETQGVLLLLASVAVQVFLAMPADRHARRVHAAAMQAVLVSRSTPAFPRTPAT